jgi:lysophospholipase L1-like esterase
MTESDLTPETTFMIDFNLHWVPAALALDVSPAAAAAMLGVSEAQFTAYVATAAERVRRTAEELLADSHVADGIDRLPVPRGGALMTIGDSITTYRYGYAELLRALVQLRRPRDEIRFINVAQSGYTSTHGLENTYSQFLAQQPDLVFVKFGVNDCKHFGSPSAKTLVSAEEYRANVAGMVQAFSDDTSARLALITPTPVVEEIVNRSPEYQAMRMTWDNKDIQACAEVVRQLAGEHHLPLVDLAAVFGAQPDPALYLADGLHPGLAGHHVIVKEVLNALYASPAY